MSIIPIVTLLISLLPAVLIIIAVVKFYQLLKEKNDILREISSKLDQLK
ncbi:hypothetical protein [Bacillus sp. B1-b2]|nr:hypothetical protein [Bacillus sp. B1-b2]